MKALAKVFEALEETDPRSRRTVGKNVKRLREERGWTQVQLAKRSGISQSLIAQLEPSNRPGQTKRIRHEKPSRFTLLRLARAFDVPMGELLK